VAWLNHLIYLLETEGLAAVGGRLEVGEAGSGWILSGSLAVAQAPPHGVKTGVKAATYYGLKVERKQGLFRARIILDV
jgi:SHS2 domain-containing protein